MANEENEDVAARMICFVCVGDTFLSSKIEEIGVNATCYYCGEENQCFSINELADFVEVAFEEHYYRTSDVPDPYEYAMMADKESDYDWERSGDPVLYAIMDAAEIDEQAANDIQEVLSERHYDHENAKMGEENDFASDSYYARKNVDDFYWEGQWTEFERELRTEARFFSKTAMAVLSSVFKGLDSMQTVNGTSLIVTAGPETELTEIYRARCFQNQQDLEIALIKPDKHLGSPPSKIAKAGRMNAHGISVFYGSNTPEVALAEVRPPVGSEVTVALFKIIRQIRLLDLTALEKVIVNSKSVFDEDLLPALEHAVFLRKLSNRIALPVLPDHEPFEYLTTQAVADFLATENDPPLDGIIFPSVQASGGAKNIVLFHKASRVTEIEVLKGTKIDVQTGMYSEDGWERDYVIFERVPKVASPSSGSPPIDFLYGLNGSIRHEDNDFREPTLKIDIDSIVVHTIDSVKFNTSPYPVRHHRFQKD